MATVLTTGGLSLVQGTVEPINATVTDVGGALTTLDGLSPVFDVVPVDPATDLDDTPAKYTNEPATNSGMMIICLIDTNDGGLWDRGKYRLYVSFTSGSQIPKLGPIDFYVI